MSRKRKRQSRRRRGVEPVDIQVRETGPDAWRSSSDSVALRCFPCGCSAHDAVKIGLEDAGSPAYPIGEGLDRSDIEEFRQAIGDEPLIWWHDCPDNENVVIRRPHRSGMRRRTCDGRDHRAGSDVASARDPYGRSVLLRGEHREGSAATLAISSGHGADPCHSLGSVVCVDSVAVFGLLESIDRWGFGVVLGLLLGPSAVLGVVLAVVMIWRERRRAPAQESA